MGAETHRLIFRSMFFGFSGMYTAKWRGLSMKTKWYNYGNIMGETWEHLCFIGTSWDIAKIMIHGQS